MARTRPAPEASWEHDGVPDLPVDPPALERVGGRKHDCFENQPSPQLQQRLSRMASEQLANADRIAETMLESYAAEIPAYAAISDPGLREDVLLVSAALVRNWLNIVATGRRPTEDMLLPIRQGARRRVVQGIDLQSLLRAYRVGTRVMWRELVATPGWRDREMHSVLGLVAEWALDYADTLATEVAAVYLAEAEDAARQREHRRSAFLSVVLAGPTPAERTHPTLHGRHVVIITEVAGEPTLPELEATGAALEAVVGVALWTVRHRRVIGVLPLGRDSDRQVVRRSLQTFLQQNAVAAVGMGCDAHSQSQTRDSYGEAVRAVELGRVFGSNGEQVFDYVDVAGVAALLDHPGRARRLVDTTLAPFAGVLGHPWGATTLEAFLTCNGHVKTMAARMNVHQSTVKYRLNAIRTLSAYASLEGDRGVSVLMALRLRRLLIDVPTPPGDQHPGPPHQTRPEAAADMPAGLEPGPLPGRTRASSADPAAVTAARTSSRRKR